jgi:hypothetical protein
MTPPPDPVPPKHALTFGDPPTQADKEGAAIAHLSLLVVHFVGPLIVYLIYKDQSAYVRYHAMQAMLLYVAMIVVAGALAVGIMVISFVTCGMGWFLSPLFGVLALVPLWPAWKAYNGDWEGLPGLGQFGR